MAIFYIKQGDTSPDYQATLTDADGNAVNLTNAVSLRFHMYFQDATTVKVDADATSVDAANGILKYVWQTGDTDTSGWFKAEFEVTYADTSVETFPNDGYLNIKIGKELA